MGRVLAAVERFEAAVEGVADSVRRAYPSPRGSRVGWAHQVGSASPIWVRLVRGLSVVAYIAAAYAPGWPRPVRATLAVIAVVVFLVLESRVRRDLHREHMGAISRGLANPVLVPTLSPRRAMTAAVACFAAAIALSLALTAAGVDEQLATMIGVGTAVLTLSWIDRRSARPSTPPPFPQPSEALPPGTTA